MTLSLALSFMAVPFVALGLLSLAACKAAADADRLDDEIYRLTSADNSVPFERADK